jgi:hypothetical protein
VIDVANWELTFPTKVAFLGPSQSGKTNSISVLCEKYSSRFDLIFLFSPHADEETWLPDNCRVNGIDFDALKRVWEYQKVNNAVNTLVILDDVRYCDLCHSEFFDDFVTRCEQDNISLFVSSSHFKTASLCIKKNIRYLITHDEMDKTIKDLCSLGKVEAYDNRHVRFIHSVNKRDCILLDFATDYRELNTLRIPLCKYFKVDIQPRFSLDANMIIFTGDSEPDGATNQATSRISDILDRIEDVVNMFEETKEIDEVLAKLGIDTYSPGMNMSVGFMFMSGVLTGIRITKKYDAGET